MDKKIDNDIYEVILQSLVPHHKTVTDSVCFHQTKETPSAFLSDLSLLCLMDSFLLLLMGNYIVPKDLDIIICQTLMGKDTSMAIVAGVWHVFEENLVIK